MQHYCKTI